VAAFWSCALLPDPPSAVCAISLAMSFLGSVLPFPRRVFFFFFVGGSSLVGAEDAFFFFGELAFMRIVSPPFAASRLSSPQVPLLAPTHVFSFLPFPLLFAPCLRP